MNNQNKNNIFNSNNFVEINDKPSLFNSNPVVKKDKKREKLINDFDSALILEKIDKTVKNKAVRISLKINALEKNLAKVKDELDLLELLKLPKDKERREDLLILKSYLTNKIDNLKSLKQKFGIYYFVSGFLEDKIDFKKFKSIITSIKSEVKKYDKIANNIIEATSFTGSPFK